VLAKQVLQLKPHLHFVLAILEMENLKNYLPGLALNYNPPDFGFPSS
jgi:hypothetical protein